MRAPHFDLRGQVAIVMNARNTILAVYADTEDAKARARELDKQTDFFYEEGPHVVREWPVIPPQRKGAR